MPRRALMVPFARLAVVSPVLTPDKIEVDVDVSKLTFLLEAAIKAVGN
jgi:hypothetical protein